VPPPSPYLNLYTHWIRHQLALPVALAVTLSVHRELTCHLGYWLLRALRLTNTPPSSLPECLRPPAGAIRSPYWATLHALRWDAARHAPALRRGMLVYAAAFVVLAWLPREAGEYLLYDVARPVLVPAARVYLHLLVSCTAVRWGVWAARAAVGFAGFAVVQAAKEVGGFWGGLVVRYWGLVLAVWGVWVSVTLVQAVDFGEVWEGTVRWVLLKSAGGIYEVGDVVRDTAGLVHSGNGGW
jgi:hypothetical protein